MMPSMQSRILTGYIPAKIHYIEVAARQRERKSFEIPEPQAMAKKLPSDSEKFRAERDRCEALNWMRGLQSRKNRSLRVNPLERRYITVVQSQGDRGEIESKVSMQSLRTRFLAGLIPVGRP